MKLKKVILSLVIVCVVFPVSYMLYYLIKHNEFRATYTSNINAKTKEEETITESTNTPYPVIEDITKYLQQQGIDTSSVGISIYNFDTKQHFERNASVNFTSASLYKVPLAMLYYDYLNEGKLQLEDTLIYEANCYEEGGPIGYTYQVGAAITIEELLYDVIVYSDNTAGHILYENLGGWQVYRSLIQAYSAIPLDTNAINFNEFSASFGNDVMIYVYEHASSYQDLIAHLKQVFPDDYLNRNVSTSIAQKYGSYDVAQNVMGIVYGEHPYALTITTTLGSSGIQVIGDINEIIYRDFHTNAGSF